MTSVIARCNNCKFHEYQDSKYGLLMRVQNQVRSSKITISNPYRCTVCGNVNEIKKN